MDVQLTPAQQAEVAEIAAELNETPAEVLGNLEVLSGIVGETVPELLADMDISDDTSNAQDA